MELNLEIEIGYEEFDSEVEVLSLFQVLTEKEAYIMKLIYINYLSISVNVNIFLYKKWKIIMYNN